MNLFDIILILGCGFCASLLGSYRGVKDFMRDNYGGKK